MTVKPFNFDEVAPIFDDMARRSIPGYLLAHESVARFSKKLHPVAKILDVGCSTAGLYGAIKQAYAGERFAYIGVDKSKAMLEQATQNYASADEMSLKCLDVAKDNPFTDAPFNAIVFGWILQFLPETTRIRLLHQAHNSLVSGGLVFVLEKYKLDPWLDEIQQEAYLDFRKQNGYTNKEIVEKTKALAPVMNPWTQRQARGALYNVGFEGIDVLYRHYNFGALVAYKT